MKKLLCILLALCALILAGCGKKTADKAPADEGSFDVPGVTAVPEVGDHGETDQSAALLDEMPTLEPVERVEGEAAGDYFSVDALMDDSTSIMGEQTEFQTYDESDLPQPLRNPNVIDPSTYQYSALQDTTLGFTFNYPSHWENVPGVFTVCFREKTEEGKFPARIAISAKRLVHSPEGTVLSDQLTSYMRMVYKQYDSSTFQVGTPNSEDSFMGKQAYSNTYLAYWGETEVKGFVIAQPVGRTLYVLHFCASYEDYTALESVMRYMVRSVQLVED